MSFLNGAKLRQQKISKGLSTILQTTCLHCLNQFNKTTRRPMMVGPCQHHYCTQCIQSVLFNREDETNCPECAELIKKEEIRRNTYLEDIVEIENQVHVTVDQSKIVELERDIAKKLLDKFPLFCNSCDKLFNIDQGRRPVIICGQLHILCSKCLRGKLSKEKKCKLCQDPIFSELKLFHFKLFELMIQFINITFLKRKLTFVVDQKQFKMTVDDEIRIKDVFHCLQENHLISNDLEIKECLFVAVVSQEDYRQMKTEVQYTNTMRDISREGDVTIFMKFAQKAIKKGASVTVSSKFIHKLPIKINNFEPQSKFRYSPQDERDPEEQRDRFEDFGERFKAQKIKQDLQQQPLYPILQIQNPMKKKQSALKYEPMKVNEPSASKLKLSKKSSIIQEKRQEQRIIRKAIKQSRIPPRKQVEQGTQISQQIMENYATKKPKGYTRDKIFNEFLMSHKSQPEDQALICYRTQKTINRQFTEEQYKADDNLAKKIEQDAKQGVTRSLLLTIIKKQLQDGDIMVLFSTKSTPRSQISLKTLTSHFISDRFIIKETFDEDQLFYFQKLYESEEELAAFLDRQKRKMQTNFGVSQESIVFHRLVKGLGSIVLYMSTHEASQITRNIRQNMVRNIEILPFFRQLQLSPDDFDESGYIKFDNKKSDVEFRGNWPYYQPINSVRQGIKVKGKFDNGDTWLSMKNQPGEWSVGFHEVINPNNAYKKCKNLIESIIASRDNPHLKVLSQSVSYEHEKCVNKQENMGVGVILTPSIEIALRQTQAIQVGGKTYHLVFQCRLKPDQIKISSKDNCKWLVNRSSAIRPYGIVILDHQTKLQYPKLQKQFGKGFIYQDHKNRIQKFL